MKTLNSFLLLSLLTASGAYCNMTSNCSQKDVISAYLDTAENSISKAKYFNLATNCSTQCNATSTCSHKDVINAFLDITADMISKLKNINHTGNDCTNCQKFKAVDCADVFQMGHKKSGIYEIWPINRVTEGKSLVVYCDMDTDGGGWTVIQRRGDFGSPKDYFYKDWRSYKAGFGKVEKDFWLGNDNIFALTHQKLYSVRFDLKDFEQNRRYAVYDKFWIDDEDHSYTLHISSYSGDAGDSMARHNRQAFATKDRDNTDIGGRKCTEAFKGAWWYESCMDANLNGLYFKGGNDIGGITWLKWKSYQALEWTEIKIRPNYFKVSYATGM